jgi:hypothetical protein
MSKLTYPPRSEQRCENCYYACPFSDGGQTCHRKPPAPNGAWPHVGNSKWCGEWAPMEAS